MAFHASPAASPEPDAIFNFDLKGWRALALLLVVAAYFVVLILTGGGLFQRLFDMRSAR